MKNIGLNPLFDSYKKEIDFSRIPVKYTGLQGIHKDSLSNLKEFSAKFKGFSCKRENPVHCTRNSCEFPVNPVKICSAAASLWD